VAEMLESVCALPGGLLLRWWHKIRSRWDITVFHIFWELLDRTTYLLQ
jgi:hypothetical protein